MKSWVRLNNSPNILSNSNYQASSRKFRQIISTLLICLHIVKWLQILLCITKNSIKRHSVVGTQLNDQIIQFKTIQFSMSFVCTQFRYQTDVFDP